MDVISLLPGCRQQCFGRGSLPAPGTLRPAHRIAVLVIVVTVVVVLRASGQDLAEAAGLVLAAGAVAARVSSWLGGQEPARPVQRGERD